MKIFSNAMKSEEAGVERGARPLPQKVQKLLARADYEPPKVISISTNGMTKLKPVTMMSNL